MISGPNWARRYTMQSPRLCARPGCQSPAAATLRFHSTRREARLVDVDGGRPSSGDLCERHACVLALPRGWRLCDHRNVLTPTAAAPAPTPAPIAEQPDVVVEVVVEAPAAIAIAARAQPEPAPQPAPEPAVAAVDEPEPVAAAHPRPLLVTEPDEAAVAEAESDALSALLDAQTPLLKRAFRNAGPS
jgi:hypothetical protein